MALKNPLSNFEDGIFGPNGSHPAPKKFYPPFFPPPHLVPKMLKHALTDFFSVAKSDVSGMAVSYFMLAAVVIAGMITGVGAAEIQTENVDGLTWQFTIENGRARIYGGLLKSAIGMTSGHVEVPGTLGGCPVKIVGSYAFNDQKDITSVSIPEGVEEIEFYACRGCSGLKSISLPSTIRTMGNAVFTGCTNLLVGVIPDSVTAMGRDMFYNCMSMTNVVFSPNVRSLGAMTCYHCDRLTHVEIPYGVTNVGVSAFSYCGNLATIFIPDSVETIGNYAFNNCPNLEPFSLPSGLKVLNAIFNGCPKIRTIKVPSATEAIDGYAFVGDYDWIDVDSGNSSFKSVNGVLYSKDGGTLVAWPRGIIPIAIPTGTRRIAERAFMNNSSLFTLELPEGLEHVDRWAFSGCSGLSSLSFPSSMVEIGDDAFRLCSSMQSVTFANGIRIIGCEAFMNCSRLPELALPPSVTLIATNAFRGCTSLASVRIESNCAEIQDWAFYGCSSLRSLYLSDGVWRVGNRAFDSAKLENGLVVRGTTVVGFADTHATSLNITEGVTGIESDVFDDYSFSDAYLPSSMRHIGSHAFKYCHNLRRITIHVGLTDIADDAFYQCPNIEEIRVVNGTMTNSVPLSWVSHYPRFDKLYGTNVILALMKPSGKTSLKGEAMYVWQDYVAGTDPTSLDDVFVVSLKMEGNAPRLEWHPDLRQGNTDLGRRTYVIYASTNLVDWTEISESDLDKYNFFKVGVRLGN